VICVKKNFVNKEKDAFDNPDQVCRNIANSWLVQRRVVLKKIALLASSTLTRQIEAKALRKLRHPSRSRKLRAFVDVAEE